MNKKDFQALILKNKDIYTCLSIDDATVRDDYPHFCIKICWKGSFNGTRVHTGRGKVEDLKAIEALAKYQKWSDQVITKVK